MDKKYLDKVLNQIVSETRIDYDEGRLYTPFPPFSFSFSSLHPFLFSFPLPFSHHCEEVYGLNRKEIEYVWKKYKHIIKDKIS